ncbi:hypothetical protein PVAND_012360 [Polypedilum vanderplanki]|uniref:Uncharacterized protein n=1 Tax=Polypedilum vanderplanki TaxID=319348 RepID=A0A9J6CM65_POLVA|nr:hypothetical protein PVAND_012360 [Polypedilum vanderplanki]
MIFKISFLILVSSISYISAGGPQFNQQTTTSIPISTTSTPCKISQKVQEEIIKYESKLAELQTSALKAVQDYANSHNKTKTTFYNQNILKIWNNYRNQITTEGTKMSVFIFKSYPAEYPKKCVQAQANEVLQMYLFVIKNPQKFVDQLLAS